MKKMILKIAVSAALMTAAILLGQFFFGTPILGREAWSIEDTDLSQVRDQSSADFSVYATKLFEQAKASPRIVEAGSLPAEQGDTTQLISGSTGISIEPDILPGTLAHTEKQFAWWPATFPGAAYAMLWLAIGAGLTFWIIHIANSHRHHHRHAI